MQLICIRYFVKENFNLSKKKKKIEDSRLISFSLEKRQKLITLVTTAIATAC